jgi:hypothetical protein
MHTHNDTYTFNAYMHTCIHTHTHTYIYTNKQRYTTTIRSPSSIACHSRQNIVYTCMYVCIHTMTHTRSTHTYIHIHAHTYMYTNKDTQRQSALPLHFLPFSPNILMHTHIHKTHTHIHKSTNPQISCHSRGKYPQCTLTYTNPPKKKKKHTY